ncbi:transmembrane protein 196-like [Mya arenaria]|uniref:transmembrane protein 196-like n=1 Tax=Mya arenaria TaxID=6604 RepID=UPI0022E3F62D|nr:transmembrane protein 196-like [Mya arenaria]
MLHIVVTSVCVISGFHALLGVISVIVGIISSSKSEVWLAHCVSPIWSGGFFIITGILGIFCARRKTSYVIMCFTAFSVVSMVTAVVSIQLLRLGLVNHTTDGQTFQKHNKDTLIIIALALAGSEILICLVSTLLSCRMAKVAKEELCKRREGMFHVKADADENYNDVTLSSGLSDNNIAAAASAASGKEDVLNEMNFLDVCIDKHNGVADIEYSEEEIEQTEGVGQENNDNDLDFEVQEATVQKDSLKTPLRLDINRHVQVFTVLANDDGSTSPRPET